MCGRFVITSPPDALRQLFAYVEQPNFPPRHNIAPTQPVPVVIIEQSARHFKLMRWGLVPSWVKDPRKFSLLINARSETVLERPAFKNAIRRRRCLVPADGYYEWQAGGGRKRPFFVYRRDREPFALAALAETWIGPNGEEVDTVAIVTCPASRDLAVLHPRMPVVIAPADFERWLEKLAPEKPHGQYAHNTGEDNADAHLKRTLMGREVVVAITAGQLDFGPWEQIFYGEFDGLRRKRVLVKIIGE